MICCEFLAKRGFDHPDLARRPILRSIAVSIELPSRADFVLIAVSGRLPVAVDQFVCFAPTPVDANCVTGVAWPRPAKGVGGGRWIGCFERDSKDWSGAGIRRARPAEDVAVT